MTGKIIAYNALLEMLSTESESLNKLLKDNLKIYNQKLENYADISNKVFDENQENINDFKTIFSSAYNSSYKTINETFENQDRIFFNKGFNLDQEKEAIYFKVLDDKEIPTERFVVTGNEIVFFFSEDTEINCIKGIIKDNNGINIVPKEIYIQNSLGTSYFLEDFNRFFEFKENKYDVQTFVSNSKKVNAVRFVFDTMPNMVLSSFKFFLLSYESTNELILKYDNVFKRNKLVKLKRNISDKYKMLKYFISFDGITFDTFDWTDPELEKLDIEDDVKILKLPDKIPTNIFIKLTSDKSVKINQGTVVKTENYIEQIVPKNYIDEKEPFKYKYHIDDKGGKIKKNSIKVYLSNKYAKLLSDGKSELIDKVSEKGRNLIADGFIDVEKERLDRSDEFFLMDFDSLDSLENIDNEIGFFIKGDLYLPSLFYEENIYFRVSYDVEFTEDSNSVNTYTPFIFDLDLMAGD